MRHESDWCVVDNSVRGGSEFPTESTTTGELITTPSPQKKLLIVAILNFTITVNRY